MSITVIPGPVMTLDVVDATSSVSLAIQTQPSLALSFTSGQGPSGAGLPVGGFTGQALVKQSNADLDYTWSYTSAAALNVTVTPVGGIAATDVQTALAELDTEKYGAGANAVFTSVQLSGGTGTQGTLSWNTAELTLDLIQNDVTLQLGQENQITCFNNSGSTIPNGSLVMYTGSTGVTGNPTISLMDGSVSSNFPKMLGITTESIANSSTGKVTTFGKVRDIDTSAYTDGATLYCDPGVAGGITAVEPTTGVDAIVGIVLRADALLGVVLVRLGGSDENHITPPIQKLADGKTNQTGFPVDAASNYLATLSYNETTRTVTITPTGSTFDIYVMGTKYTFTGAQSIVHSATGTNQFIYFDSTGTLVTSTTPWDLLTTAPACFVFQDVTNSRRIAFDERHHAGRDVYWHRNQHTNEGTKVSSGFVASGYTLNDGATDAALQWAVSSGRVEDEDIRIDTEVLPAAGPYNILERVGVSGEWQLTRTSTLPFLYSGNILQYNQFTGATWQRTNVTEDYFVNYWIYASTSLPTAALTPTPSSTQQVVIVAGQTLFTTSDLAAGEIPSSILWGTLPFTEMAPLYRVTMRYNASNPGAYTNTARTAISAITRMVGTYTSLTAASVTDHGALSGLSDPDHPASAIVFTPTGSIAATTVQAALAELDSEKLATTAIGTTVQAYDADLTTWAGITPGTGVGTALAVAVGTAGAVVVNGGALGTPSSGTATNLSGTAASLTAGAATLAASTSALKSASTDVNVASATAPTSGQVLTATSSTAATWQTPAGASATLTVSNKTAAYSVVAGDNGAVIRTTSGSGAITLPSCATVGVGFTFIYTNSSSGNVNNATVGSDTFSTGETLFAVAPGQSFQWVVTDATSSGKWQMIRASTSGSGVRSNAIGYKANASGTDAVAIGNTTNASGSGAIAIYGTATANYSVAIGANSSALPSQAVTGSGAMALGGSYASGQDSFAAAVGNNTSTYGAQGTYSLAIGYQAKATFYGSTAIGSNQNGIGSIAAATGAMALGGSYCSGVDSLSAAIGTNSTLYGAQGANSIAMGYQAKATGVGSVALGGHSGLSSPVATGQSAVALGTGYATGVGAFAVMTEESSGSYGAKSNYSIAIGQYATAVTGVYAIAVGRASTATGIGSIAITAYHDVIGSAATASGKSAVAIGQATQATAETSYAFGTMAIADKYGKQSYASGAFVTAADAQTGTMVLRTSTITATPAVLTSNGGAASTTNQVILPNDSTYAFTAIVVARRTDIDNESAAYKFEGCIDRNGSAVTTTLVGAVAKTIMAEDTTAWDCNVTADTTNGGLAFTVTGEAAKTIRWVATVNTTEVTG